MQVREWMRSIMNADPALVREMGEHLVALSKRNRKDAVNEAAIRAFIDSLPAPQDNGLAASLKDARAAAGRCCRCGRNTNQEMVE